MPDEDLYMKALPHICSQYKLSQIREYKSAERSAYCHAGQHVLDKALLGLALGLWSGRIGRMQGREGFSDRR